MSIDSEVARLEDAKSAIISAIESKNVEVPNGTKLDDLAALIAEIEVGGSGGTNWENVTFTVTLGGGSFYYTYYDDSGVLTYGSTNWTTTNEAITFQVAKNSVAAINNTTGASKGSISGTEKIYWEDEIKIIRIDGDGRIELYVEEVSPV